MTRILSAIFAVLLLALPQAVAAAYSLAPGDTLQVEVVEDPSLNRNVLVLPDGSINFPGAGSLRAAGLTAEAISRALVNRLAPQFANPPTVYVSVARLAPEDPELPTADLPEEAPVIYVMGEINQPGVLEVKERITLLQAIAQAGGFTRFAATKRVELHRMDPGTQTEQVYLFDYRNRGGISGGTILTEGDVIVVPERRLFE